MQPISARAAFDGLTIAPNVLRIQPITMHVSSSFRQGAACLTACMLVFLCAGTPVPAQHIEYPSEQEVLKDASRKGSIPQSEPVWVDHDGTLKKLEPGTEEYFHARVEGRYYVSENRLTGCVKMLFRITDHASGGVLATHMTPAVDQSADTEVRGLVPARTFLIGAQSTNDLPVGRLMGCNVAPGASAAVTTASGRRGTYSILNIVEPISLEQYVKMWDAGQLETTAAAPVPEPAPDADGSANASRGRGLSRPDHLPPEKLTDRQLSSRLYDLRRNKAHAQRRVEWLKASISKINKALTENIDVDRAEVLRGQLQLRISELQELENGFSAADDQLLEALSELDQRRR